MDVSRPVMSSALELACPHCGHADEDSFEFLDDNRLQALHCPDCNQTGFFAVMECQACGVEQFFAWQASPSSQEFLALQCGHCNQRYADHETTAA